MDIAPRDVPSDELQALIQNTRAELDAVAAAPWMRREPLRLMMTALSGVLSVFGKSIHRWERAVADVITARNLSSGGDHAALKADLVEAVESGAFRGMRKEAQRMVRTFDRRLAATFGISIGAAFIVGGCAAWALVVFAHWGPYSQPAESAAAWRDLVQNNPDPRPAMATAEIKADGAGRRYYSGLALWLDPARPPNSQ